MCRLLGAKLLFEYTNTRATGGSFESFGTNAVGTLVGFCFAEAAFEGSLLARLPKTIVPSS